MKEIPVTWLIATHIWWSLLWRTVLIGVISAVVVGGILGGVLSVLGMSDKIGTYAQIAGYLVGIPVGIYVVKKILTMQFRRYRIALLPSQEAILEQAVRSEHT